MKYKGKGKYIQYNTIQGNLPGEQPARQRWKEILTIYKNIKLNTRTYNEIQGTGQIHGRKSTWTAASKTAVKRRPWGDSDVGEHRQWDACNIWLYSKIPTKLYEISRSKRISGHMIALTKQCRTVELLFEVVIYWNLSRQHFKRRAAQKSSYRRKAIFHISWEGDQLLRQKGVEEYETTIFGIHY